MPIGSRLPTLAALALSVFVIGGCGGSDDESAEATPRGSWAVVESLLADQPGWNARLAHEARLAAQGAGGTAKEGEDCYLGQMLPGEWPRGCEVYADLERTSGALKRGKQELNRGIAAEEEHEAECGVTLHAQPGYAEGPEGDSLRSLRIACGDVGAGWPLTVKQGLLQCESEVLPSFTVERVTFEAPDGTVYGVNGSAVSVGYPRIDPIWKKDDSAGYGLKVNISPLIDRGLRLCAEAE